jgi:hypothetical protein
MASNPLDYDFFHAFCLIDQLRSGFQKKISDPLKSLQVGSENKGEIQNGFVWFNMRFFIHSNIHPVWFNFRIKWNQTLLFKFS